MSDELISKSATELARLLRTREVSSADIVEAFLRQIEKLNPSLNALVTIAPDVVKRAQTCDVELAAGNIAGPLHGLPVTVKDTIDTEGIRTTYGSRVFAEHVPARDATVVARLKAAGAIILGKTNTPEMAIPYETENPVFGRTNNPHDLNRTCGGSSGGEAAVVAAKLSPAGIGSDLSGSIRVPAHFCGIAGLKPTTGAVPMDGHVPNAVGSLALGAAVGPMARYTEDLRLLFRVMSKKSEISSSSEVNKGRVGVGCYVDPDVAPVIGDTWDAVQRASDMLRGEGFEVHEARPPGFAEGHRLWIELFSAAAAEEMRSLYRGREQDAGPLVLPVLNATVASTRERRIEVAEAMARAVLERERHRERLLQWMKTTPLILSPVSSAPAFEHGAKRVEAAGRSISVFRSCAYSQTVNVFGLPAVVVPVARTVEGLPIGVQIIGRPFEEEMVLNAATVIERAVRFV